MSWLSFKELLNSDAVSALCWALVHSLWLGLIVAALSGLFLVLTKRSRPAVRYQVLCGLFILFILGTVGTFLYEQQNFNAIKISSLTDHRQDTRHAGVQAGSPVVSAPLAAPFRFPAVIIGLLSRNAPLIVALWLLGLSGKILKMIFSLGYTSSIRKRKAHEPAPFWKSQLVAYCTGLGITRAVTLLESEIIKLPLVFGHLKPVIFVPLGLLAALPAGQVEAILLHELAHIRRNDYLVNLLQHLVETLFFFNPALLWLSSLIREERENCCDEIAISQTRDRKQFIEALISFRQLAVYPASRLAVAFPGRKSSLVNRVTRIVYRRNYTLNTLEKGSLLGCCLVAVLLLLVFTRPTQIRPKRSAVPLTLALTPPDRSMDKVVKNAVRPPRQPAKRLQTLTRTARATTDTVRPDADLAIHTDITVAIRIDTGPPGKRPGYDYPLPQVIGEITRQLRDKGLITDTRDLVIELTNTHLLVNGSAAPDAVWGKLRQQYLQGSPYPIDPDQLKDPAFGIYYNSYTHFQEIGVHRARPAG